MIGQYLSETQLYQNLETEGEKNIYIDKNHILSRWGIFVAIAKNTLYGSKR